jgi:hypothetical protein
MNIHRATTYHSTRIFLALTLVLAILGLVPTATHAATLDVCPSGCTYTSIQAAIDAAALGDKITIGAGAYDGMLAIGKNLTLQGAGAAQTTINGGVGGSVITIAIGTTVTIDGVTITGGSGQSGGGIFNQGTLTVSNSTISGNSASSLGGGIYNNGGSVTVSNSTFAGNSAGFGGGIHNNNGGSVTVSNSTFAGNSATIGGGIRNSGGSVTVSNSTFAGNSASNIGGGIYSSAGGTLTVSNSAFFGNSASDAGGIFNGLGSVTVSNSTFAGNSASDTGGGVLNLSTLMVSNSTFFGNSASSFGGGIFNRENGTLTVSNSTISDNGAQPGGGIANLNQLTLANTIVANSQGGDCFNDDGSISATGVNLIEDGSCNVAAALLGDPKLGPLQDNGGPTQTVALLVGSPAIDAIPSANCAVATDQRGVERPQDGNGDGIARCDIGAFELQVIFLFTGFFQPIDNLPTVNSVKAGSAIPVKFSLGGDYGLSIFASGYPKVQQVACGSAAATDEVEQTVTVGASGLSYDTATGQYSYTWKTDKKWAGSCRQLVVRLIDGSEHIASFQFR